jgi:hypothetical protein
MADTSLFLYSKGDVTVFLLIYVDDIIVASSTPCSLVPFMMQIRQGAWMINVPPEVSLFS